MTTQGVARDVRQAVRSLRKSPAFTTIAVLCLALGIGANAAIFSVVNTVLLRPLPYPAPERLVRLFETMRDQPGWQGSVSHANYLDWRAEAQSFEQLAAYSTGSRNLQGTDVPERIITVAATANLPALVGGRTILGRGFLEEDDEPGAAPVALLHEDLWRRRFNADPAIIGRTINLNGSVFTVIGVLASAFDFPVGGEVTGVYLPLVPAPDVAQSRGAHALSSIARLREGVTPAQAQREMMDIALRLEKLYPGPMANRGVDVVSLRELAVGRLRPTLYVLLGAVGLVLLIACANVANLLLARSAARRHEVAVRLALGAGRGVLIRQFLVESTVLAIAGTIVGGLVAWLGLHSMKALLIGAIPIATTLSLDLRILGFLVLIAAVTGIIVGLVPALQISGADLRDTLTESGTKSTSTGGHQRFRSALVVGEIALSLILLVGAGLLMRGFYLLQTTEPGLVTNRVLTAHIAIPRATLTPEQITPRLLQPILERVRAVPGVERAATISMLPIQEAYTNFSYGIVGEPAAEPGKEPLAEFRVASPGFFGALGIPVRRGRDFTEQDGLGTEEVVIINEALASAHFKGKDPIGQLLTGMSEKPKRIIGVVGNVRQAGLDREPLREVYFPYQSSLIGYMPSMSLVIKTRVDPETLVPAVSEAVRSVDRDQPVYRVRTMEQIISESLSSRRLNLWLLGVFAGVALLLSAAGLYGVISYLVTQRTREIGIRMALGAEAGDVVRLMMGRGAMLIGGGIVLGLVGAFAFTRWLESMLYGVTTHDPLTFATIPFVLVVVALIATWLPARRASRLDPVTALRTE
jgi:predicted permease